MHRFLNIGNVIGTIIFFKLLLFDVVKEKKKNFVLFFFSFVSSQFWHLYDQKMIYRYWPAGVMHYLSDYLDDHLIKTFSSYYFSVPPSPHHHHPLDSLLRMTRQSYENVCHFSSSVSTNGVLSHQGEISTIYINSNFLWKLLHLSISVLS